MSKERILEYCKYHDGEKCPYRAEYIRRLVEATERGENVDGLQPRCPRDAQRNKRGVLMCICERSERL